MYCCKCLFENTGSFDDRKMYKMPIIRFRGQPMGSVVGWEIYCEECVKEHIEEEYEVNEEQE